MASKKKAETKKTAAAAAAETFGDNIHLGEHGQKLFVTAGSIGAVALALSLLWGWGNYKQFAHSYLVAFMWTLAIGLGALWWVTLQHLVNAKWSIVVRRVGELVAANMTLLAVLALPIVVPALVGSSSLFVWVDSAKMHADHLLHHKTPYLNIPFFAVRFLLYFGFWALLARYFLIRSIRQDVSGNPELMASARRTSGPAMIAVALTLTFAAFDFLMSLSPTWFSTIFGVYYFAGCVVSVNSFFALCLMWLQSKGRLVKSVTTEHYHDLGKMMFAFTVFWSYIAFSQFMLIWYANIPEETEWYHVRISNGWQMMSWILLFGHFVIPFFGLLSRHIKRNRKTLAFWAVWILVMEYVDMYWLVMPHLSEQGPAFHLLDITCLIGIAGIFISGIAFQARKVNLVPVKDPRLPTSLAFENF